MKILFTCALLTGWAMGQAFDGPAELPRVTMQVGLINTPSLNPPKVIEATDDLQKALNGAVCGDNFQVSCGWTGMVNLPTLACDQLHWITIANSCAMPSPGTRVAPGLAMPRIMVAGNGHVRGGAFVRLVGFEITRPDTTAAWTGAFVTPGIGAHDIIFDRVYVHGTPTTESVRGFDLSNVTGVAIVDSWVSEFHCLAPGRCSDSQAIAGGVGTVADGNYLIQNNYLESSGENILFGGSSATVVPGDITIRQNDLAKLMSWNPADPSYAPVNGLPWQVKNLFELKTGRRVLFEDNNLTGTWGGFSQTGYAILLTPKNQAGQCAVCAVEDVTLRGNTISKVGEALQLALAPTFDGFWAAGAARWSIHDNTFTGLQYSTCYKCGQWPIQLSSGISPTGLTLHKVSIDHNSFLQDGWLLPGAFLTMGAPPSGMADIRYTNNLQYSGKFVMWSTGGGAANCATGHQGKPAELVNACWTGASSMTGNVILMQPGVTAVWPVGNDPVTAGAGLK